MPSFTTIYRAIVMIATGVIVVKGWQLYGPSSEQVKTFAVEAVEMAQSAWIKSQQNGPDSATLATDPRVAVSAAGGQHATIVADNAPAYSIPGQLTPAARAAISPPALAEAPAVADLQANTELDQLPVMPADAADRLPALLSHLESIGGADPQLAPWGASGELYRFCCRAKLEDTSVVARHFEAVAAEPAVAVEQVVAKLEAWRTAQRDPAALR